MSWTRMKIKEVGLAATGIRLGLLWLSVAILACIVDSTPRPHQANSSRISNNIDEPNNYRRSYTYLKNKDIQENCLCSVNGRQKLCGSPSCPCQKYSGNICMKALCSCLNYGSCRTFFHTESGYSCPCLGDLTGFNCSVVDRLPACKQNLDFTVSNAKRTQKLICFPKDGANPKSPCKDAEDDLVYTLAKGQNISANFKLHAEDNQTCLWFHPSRTKSVYTVTIVATELDEVYSRPERSDTFQFEVFVKTHQNPSQSFSNFTPTFVQFNFDRHPLQNGINFSVKAVSNKEERENKIIYQLIDVTPESFFPFVQLNPLTGDIFVLKPNSTIGTRQIVNISIEAVDKNNNFLSAIFNTMLNLIFAPPHCQVIDPVSLYTSVSYEHALVGNLHCLTVSGLGPFIFQVQQNNSGLNFMTEGTQLLVSGTPTYPSGRYFLKVNVRDKFGDLGITRIPYIIVLAPVLQVKTFNFSTVEVSWQFSTPEMIKSYKLNISEMTHVYSFDLKGSTYKQEINNLQPMKNYSFQIGAKVGNSQTLVPSNVFMITTPRNVSAVCTPVYNGSFPSSDSALRCGAVNMKCQDPGKPDTRNLVYQFAGSFTQLSVKNVTCLHDKCLFCFPKNSEGNYQLDVTVDNQRLDIKYALPIHLHIPKPPVCESKTDFFNVSELAQRDFIVGRIKVKNPPESGTLRLTILRPAQWLPYFYLSQDGVIHIHRPIDQLDNMNISLNLRASNRVGHCTVDAVIHVVDENEPPSCNFPNVVHLMHPVSKQTRIVYLNCTDPDILQENSQVTISLQPDPQFATQMFEINSAKAIYAKTDIPLNVVAYNLKVIVKDSASPPGHQSYPLKLFINDSRIQRLILSFKITSIPSNNVFSNPNSDSYNRFTRKFTDSVSKFLFQLKGFLQAEFFRIRPGTTIADIGVIFDHSGQMSLIKSAYISAVKNGFSNFSIDPNYIQISTQNHPGTVLIEKALQVSPIACIDCNVTYMCCAQPSDVEISFDWSFNGFSINKPSDKMELIGLESLCGSCSGQSQCLTMRPLTDSVNSTLSCKVSTSENSSDYVTFNVITNQPPQVILNLSSQYSITGLQEEFIICSLSKPQDSFPITFKWFLDSVPLNNNNEHFQLQKLSAFSEVLYIKQLKQFHHISCKVCFGDGVPCSQSNVIYNLEKTNHFCPADTDSQGRIWRETMAGKNQTLPCPENSTGNIVRTCDMYGHWNSPSQQECVDLAIWEIFSKLRVIKNSNTPMKKQVASLLESLSKITEQQETLDNHNCLETGTKALGEFSEISKSLNKISNKEAMNFYQTASNLLSAKHKIWDVLNTKNNGVQKLMKVIGDFGNSIVNNLDNVLDEPVFQTENMDVQIGQTKSKDIVFPKPDCNKSNVIISQKTLESFLPANETVGYTAIYYKNLASLLTNKPDFFSDMNQTLKMETVNSDVLAVTLASKLPAYLDPPVQLTFQHIQKNMINPLCSFWDFNSNVSLMGSWSTDGCNVKYTDDKTTVCVCDHLTNFAVLMSPVKINELHRHVLSYITIVGCSFSILGCLLTLGVYAYLWRYMRRHRATVLIHLCISLIIADIVFLAGIEQTSSKVWCTSIAIVLHYFYLVVFFTMLAEGLDMAISVTYVFATKSRTCYLLPMAWGMPAVIVGITMASTRLKGYGNPRFCWLSFEEGMIWAFVAPAAIIIAVNLVVIILVFRAMCSTSSMLRKSVEEKAKSGAHGACVLLPVLGLTWLFGIFSINEKIVAFQYLFALFNSMQGLLIFVFHCVLNKQIRDAFWKKTSHLSPSSRTSSRSSPRYITHETAKRLPSGLPPKTIGQGLEKPYKNGKDVKDFSTADQKTMKKLYSLSAFLQCPVTSDPKCFSQAKHFKSSEGKKCIKHQDSKNGIKTRHKQRAVKFEMDKN